MPVSADCFNYIEFAGKTDEEKIDYELEKLTLTDKLGADKIVEVLAAGADYSEVVLTWASNSEYAVVADDGLSIAFTIPTTETTVTITVTDTEGNVESLNETAVQVELSDKALAAGTTVALPIEATAIGNLLAQLIFLYPELDLAKARKIVIDTFDIKDVI